MVRCRFTRWPNGCASTLLSDRYAGRSKMTYIFRRCEEMTCEETATMRCVKADKMRFYCQHHMQLVLLSAAVEGDTQPASTLDLMSVKDMLVEENADEAE